MASYHPIGTPHTHLARLRRRTHIEVPLQQPPHELRALARDQSFHFAMFHAQHRRRLQPIHDQRKLLAGRRKLFRDPANNVCLLHERASIVGCMTFRNPYLPRNALSSKLFPL